MKNVNKFHGIYFQKKLFNVFVSMGDVDLIFLNFPGISWMSPPASPIKNIFVFLNFHKISVHGGCYFFMNGINFILKKC